MKLDSSKTSNRYGDSGGICGSMHARLLDLFDLKSMTLPRFVVEGVFKSFGIGMIALVFSGCTPSSDPVLVGTGSSAVRYKPDCKVEDLIDIAYCLTTDIPEAQQDIEYTDNQMFDYQLYAAMKEGFQTINVSLGSFDSVVRTPDLTPRLNRWMRKIEDTKGEVKPCVRGQESLWNDYFVPIVIMAWEAFRNYRTYVPAKRYNALVWIDKSDQTLITEVQFVYRTSAPLYCEQGL